MKKKRQAVVIIHGIGEQHPMKTLRGFVSSLLNYEKKETKNSSNKRTFWTKPDRISNSYELRKITAKGCDDKRSTTHFYEYHWAANMRDTKWKHVLRWFRSLMCKDPRRFRSIRLFILWVALWAAPLSWAVIASIFSNNLFIKKTPPLESLSFFQIAILTIPFLLFILHNIFIGFIGDAARYLRVDVENIYQREIIRKNGVDLLKALHKTEEYDRIIVVGHSLGSVIAYDIITYLWIDFNKALNLNEQAKYNGWADNKWGYSFGSIKQKSKELKNIVEWSKSVEKNLNAKEQFNVDKFQANQSALWKSIQHFRKSWLITDLITLGSPLAHAEFLMSESKTDFLLRKNEREYPICPPLLDENELTYSNDKGETYLHHATPFAVTRWSNLYYKGDFIGGKLVESFGPGIKDIEVKLKGKMFKKIESCINPLLHNR